MTLYQIDPHYTPVPSYDGYYQSGVFDNSVLANTNQKDSFKSAIAIVTSSILCIVPISYKYLETSGSNNTHYIIREIPSNFPEIAQESPSHYRTDEPDYGLIFGSEEPDIVFLSKNPVTTFTGRVERAVHSAITTDPEDEFWLD